MSTSHSSVLSHWAPTPRRSASVSSSPQATRNSDTAAMARRPVLMRPSIPPVRPLRSVHADERVIGPAADVVRWRRPLLALELAGHGAAMAVGADAVDRAGAPGRVE